MKLYRLELNGTGIYMGEAKNDELFHIIDEMTDKHADLTKYPNGYKDEIYENLTHSFYNFACPSIDALFKWFDGFLEDLLKFDEIKLLEIDVDSSKVVKGKSGLQCVYPYLQTNSVKEITA